jgi:RNA polymerase sigma-70 factor (ECF subfamily)
VPNPQENEAIAEESRLLARAGAGDREAFRLLYARYSAPLFSLAIRLVGDVGDAEEALQDAFMKVWRNAASYDPGKSRPFTGAVTVMRRTCIDHLRKRRRIPRPAPFLADDEATIGHGAGDSVRGAAEAREDADRIRGALADAAPNQRLALELALFSGMTHAEIAQRLGQPVGTVKSWIRRGLLDLRTTLTESLP